MLCAVLRAILRPAALVAEGCLRLEFADAVAVADVAAAADPADVDALLDDAGAVAAEEAAVVEPGGT